MAGHNRWSKVKHRKAVVDKRKGKALTMCSRAIMVAARHGGPDPEFNNALRQALDDARYHNVPKENIDRAIKKGISAGEGDDYESVRYEGYGPAGVAVVVDALTNNRTRTAADLRLIFGKFGGNLGTTGCVSFMFQTLGRIVVAGTRADEERLFEAAAGAGAEDLTFDDDGESPSFVVLAPVASYLGVRSAIEATGLTIREAGIEHVPTTLTRVDAAPAAKDVLDLIDALEDNDDVKKVYSTADIADDVLASME